MRRFVRTINKPLQSSNIDVLAHNLAGGKRQWIYKIAKPYIKAFAIILRYRKTYFNISLSLTKRHSRRPSINNYIVIAQENNFTYQKAE